MESQTRERIESHIFHWQAKFGLGDWDIRLADAEPSREDRGSTDIWSRKRSAFIRIAAACPEAVEEEIVIHELLHVVLHPIVDPLYEALTRHASPAAKEEIIAAAKNAEEAAIHQLTCGFVGHGVQCWLENEMAQPIWAEVFPVVKRG